MPGLHQAVEIASVISVGTKAERRAAREPVAASPDACLSELVEQVASAIDRYRAGKIHTYTVDETIHQYHRAARELWKFCWSTGVGTHVEFIAHLIDEQTANEHPPGWWERGTPHWRRGERPDTSTDT